MADGLRWIKVGRLQTVLGEIPWRYVHRFCIYLIFLIKFVYLSQGGNGTGRAAVICDRQTIKRPNNAIFINYYYYYCHSTLTVHIVRYYRLWKIEVEKSVRRTYCIIVLCGFICRTVNRIGEISWIQMPGSRAQTIKSPQKLAAGPNAVYLMTETPADVCWLRGLNKKGWRQLSLNVNESLYYNIKHK